jgi:hypothetical protein
MSYKLSNFHNYINIYSNKKTLVNLNNWTCGFGSALSCLIDNITYLNQFNIKVKPLWNKNSDNFKYSNGIDDCFSIIFDDNLNMSNVDNTFNIISDVPHINGAIESSIDTNLNQGKKTFNSRFNIKKIYYDKFNEISEGKDITFSIHLRSNVQKRIHNKHGILNIKRILEFLQNKYGKDCTPFIATDVKLYLDFFLLYFPNAIYNKECFRVLDDVKDIIPRIKEPSIKYAEDVIIDIIGLSKGNHIYLSYSNFYTIVSYIIDNKVINNLHNI